MKVLSKVFCTVLLVSQVLLAYSQLIPIPLEQKIAQSELIVEGRVTGQLSYIAPDGEIYTENEIEILSVVKGGTQEQTATVVTMGGKINGNEVTWTHLAKLDLNQYGVFFLVKTRRPTREIGQQAYEIYSSSQGFYQVFRDDNSYRVACPFDWYDDPNEFYQKLGIEDSAIHGTFTKYINRDKNCIIYKIVPRIPTGLQSSSKVVADVFVKAEEGSHALYKANLVVGYSEEIFGQNIVSSGNLSYTGGELVTSSYSLSFIDYSSNQLEVKLDANTANIALLEEIGTEYKKIATIEVNILGWSSEPPLDWDPNDATITNQYIDPQTNLIKEFECTDVIFEEQGGGIDVTGLEPTRAAAGVGMMSANPMPIPGVVKITGTGFSDPAPGEKIPEGYRVKFNTVDGGWIAPLEGDYISWSNTEILVKVPSIGYDNNSDDIISDINTDVACTGKIRVCRDGFFACGTNDDTPVDLYIPFCARNNYQTRADNYKESVRNILLDFVGGGYRIYFTQEFKDYPGAVAAFKRALTTWRCATRVNFSVDEVNPYPGGNVNGNCLIEFWPLPIGVTSITRGGTSLAPVKCGDEPNIDFYFAPNFLIRFNEDIDWHTGTNMPTLDWDGMPSGTVQGDLESTALHELGHAHLLNHTCNSPNVMVSPGPNDYRRTLTMDDEDGGNHISLLSSGTDDAECPKTGMELIGLEECDITPVVEINGSTVALMVFPNPTLDNVTLKFSADHGIFGKILVHDFQGKLVSVQNIELNTGSIQLTGLPSGIYNLTLILESGEQSSIGKIVKK
ncbi:MAG TPA: zinc-dependent metalloprotease [Saprospiraceae bacterium]|nr:zinc-dependent metalloprotease [Saprospiraceae bacterium]HMQ81742.1 zinc-dependent metalloprotease [Saprospiraceae bacterium]